MTCVRTMRALGRYLPVGYPLNLGPQGEPSPASHSHFLMSTGGAHLNSEVTPYSEGHQADVWHLRETLPIPASSGGTAQKEQQAEVGITYAARQLWPGCSTKVPCVLFGSATPFHEALVSRVPTF